MAKLPGLMTEEYIACYPSLAKRAGINKALILQKLHYLLKITERAKSQANFHDGRWWVYNRYPDWRDEHFPWLAVGTIQRLFLALEEDGIVLSHEAPHPLDGKPVKFYAIRYEVWDAWFYKAPSQNVIAWIAHPGPLPSQNVVAAITKCGGWGSQNVVAAITKCDGFSIYRIPEPTAEPTNAEHDSAAAETPESTDCAAGADAAAAKTVIEKALADIGLGKDKHDLVLALEPEVALALIWDAQERGIHPPGLLVRKIEAGDKPPLALRELAAIAIREGTHIKAEAETAWRKDQLEALAREADEHYARRKAELAAQGGDAATSDSVTDVPSPAAQERPAERAVRLWREWWPDTKQALTAAGCPEFLIKAIRDAKPGVLSDGTVRLIILDGWGKAYREVLEPVLQRLEEALKKEAKTV